MKATKQYTIPKIPGSSRARFDVLKSILIINVVASSLPCPLIVNFHAFAFPLHSTRLSIHREFLIYYV